MIDILVLDDNCLELGNPEPWMDPNTPDLRRDHIVQVASPEAFWREYAKQTWHQIWVDHDLGSSEYSGRTVTKRFYEEGPIHNSHVGIFFVTTMNPGAAGSMESDLRQTGVEVKHYPISFMRDLGVSRGLVIPHTDRHLAIVHGPIIP